MTDLPNGKLDVFGVEINSDTKINDFVNNWGDKFSRIQSEEEQRATSYVQYVLNDAVGLIPEHFNPDVHLLYKLHGMEFIQIIVAFREEKICEIKLISNIKYYEQDEYGNAVYSPQKEEEAFQRLNKWAINELGIPSYRSSRKLRWIYEWGTLAPSSLGAGANIIIEYGRIYGT